ncbi:g11233 [Coccomyxa viridis]|uniref:Ubiquinol oxidase n=1 Tax=Coccomyxa viridis TaxID=1274662 RepID=A0ABP1GBW1_9CHLO
MEAIKRREGHPLPHPSIRLDAYRGQEQYMTPYYPDAYLESKHCKIFAHWRTPKGLAEWTGFLAAQLYNAGTAVVAHVPAWLPGVSMQRETVWLRRLVLLESIAPVLGSTAAMAAYAKALWSLQQDARYLQAFQQESDNARAHLVALLSVSPSAAQKLLVLLNQVLLAPPYALAFALAPRVCHAFVSTLSGLTGEALSDALVDLDAGKAPAWDVQSLPAPVLAYWGLPEGASMRSVLLVMRADVNARMIINQGADFKTLSLNGELSSLEEYFNEEDPLDYTPEYKDVVIARNLYNDEQSDVAEGPASGQSRSYTTSATRELPTIRERRPSGLRRFWGSASSGGSQRAPSVASVASSAAESAPEQLWPRSRKVASPSSSASSDLDSAQALSHRRPKGTRARRNILHVEVPEEDALQGRKGRPSGKVGAAVTTTVDALEGRGSQGRKGASSGRGGADILTAMDKLWGQGS